MTTTGTGRRARIGNLAARFAVELLIGLAIAVLLIVVGWASSNAIRFVYGGY